MQRDFQIYNPGLESLASGCALKSVGGLQQRECETGVIKGYSTCTYVTDCLIVLK